MSICDGCIHDYVCGLEDNHEEGIVSCADRIPKDVLQQEPKWIPVSERLPKPYTWVYVTCHSLVNDWDDWVIDTIYEPQPKGSHYSDWGNIEMLNDGECEVIAWMEWISPEPYKQEV